MTVEIELLAYAELYSIEYQRGGLKLSDLKADMVAEAICMPHITTLSRYIAMQTAVNFVDTIIEPVWNRIALDAMRARAQAALNFVAKNGGKDN